MLAPSRLIETSIHNGEDAHMVSRTLDHIGVPFIEFSLSSHSPTMIFGLPSLQFLSVKRRLAGKVSRHRTSEKGRKLPAPSTVLRTLPKAGKGAFNYLGFIVGVQVSSQILS